MLKLKNIRKVKFSIGDEIAKEVTKRLQDGRRKAGLRKIVRNLFKRKLEANRSWISLSSHSTGSLLGHFGIPDPEGSKEEIMTTWLNSITVSDARRKTRANGSFFIDQSITGIDDSYEDVLSLKASYHFTRKGKRLNWLEWLLIRGDEIIIDKWDVKFGLSPAERSRSRTGLAIMVGGNGWHVPFEHSGVPNRNMVTRVIDTMQNELRTRIEEYIQRNLS